MHHISIRVESTKMLTRSQLKAVLQDLHAKSASFRIAHLNLILVRLACWGIAGWPVRGGSATIANQARASKGGRSRTVASGGTLERYAT